MESFIFSFMCAALVEASSTGSEGHDFDDEGRDEFSDEHELDDDGRESERSLRTACIDQPTVGAVNMK